METLVRIDEALIDAVENGLYTARNKLGASYPKAMAFCLSTTIVVMAFATFISSSNFLTVKIPVLCLYAVLAYMMGRTSLRYLADFHVVWNPELERITTRDALGNRQRLRPFRALLAFGSIVFTTFSLAVSLKLLGFGAISPVEAVRDVLSSLLGIPMLLAYQYVMCARPSGKPTFTP
ncbi:hypothetical protein OIU34_22330 [Pararhizobium sp. BT-229]|uniref:hypothetical protein n=1 Tax=Pararhizobium sp. BT-229 TaxID=2986923 RepID=UPI0021F6D727|nr:hypothetical protein [Pararhizobium sp. BT-229]MCV9964632.1 hypothetical protein [Pararhizobium sp. BT-229]